MAKKKPKKSPPKRSRKQVGKLSRNKGKVFEREIARDLRGIYGNQVKRGWQAREGTDAPDVENVPFWVECKHHRKVNVRAAVAQARADVEAAGRELPILVVVKDNGQPPLAVVDWEVMLKLLKNEAGNAMAVSLAAHLEAANKVLDQLLGPVTDIETTIGDRIRALAARGRVEQKVEVPVFKMSQPRDHRDRPAGLDDGTV